MPSWVIQGFGEYQKRMPPDMRLELEEIPLPKRSKGDTAALVRAEGEALEKRLTKYPGAHQVALEVGGRALSKIGRASCRERV